MTESVLEVDVSRVKSSEVQLGHEMSFPGDGLRRSSPELLQVSTRGRCLFTPGRLWLLGCLSASFPGTKCLL